MQQVAFRIRTCLHVLLHVSTNEVTPAYGIFHYSFPKKKMFCLKIRE